MSMEWPGEENPPENEHGRTAPDGGAAESPANENREQTPRADEQRTTGTPEEQQGQSPESPDQKTEGAVPPNENTDGRQRSEEKKEGAGQTPETDTEDPSASARPGAGPGQKKEPKEPKEAGHGNGKGANQKEYVGGKGPEKEKEEPKPGWENVDAATEAELNEEIPSDFYELLGVDPSADRATIQSAYRNKIKKYTPDKYQKDRPDLFGRANEWMRNLNDAFATLKDPRKRMVYDINLPHLRQREKERKEQEARARQSAGAAPGGQRTGQTGTAGGGTGGI